MHATASAWFPAKSGLRNAFQKAKFKCWRHALQEFRKLPPPNTEFVSELAKLFQEYSWIEDCDQENIQYWLECDVGGHQLPTDDEILASFKENKSPSEDYGNEEDFSEVEQVEKDHPWRKLFGA